MKIVIYEDELYPFYHFDYDIEQKTYFGAVITILVRIAFLGLFLKSFLDMVGKKRTYFCDLEK